MTAPQNPDRVGGSDSGPAADRPALPRLLNVARWLWIAAALLGLVRAYVQLSDRKQLSTDLRAALPDLSQTQLDDEINGLIMFNLLYLLALLALYISLTTRMTQGKNWARVVLTVFGGFGAFGTLGTLLLMSQLGQAELMRLTQVRVDPSDLVFGALVTAVEVAALVLMFLPESNRFFREFKRPRPPQPYVAPGGDPFAR
ncbi:hypothetical protein [Saccharopolyspora gloriosae]|uniref:hypothetical protein n=1 Tax=Saccharopolyspora gloriosae TaxID=455344 RepID=UPI001FB75CE2|nr:hypothetical protein [Saccharopolyspora gloriosae]